MSAYTDFVKSYHRKHPTLKGKGFIRSAAKAWRGRRRRRNPEVTTSPDEVVLVIPTELLAEMSERGGDYEGVPLMENPGFFTGSDGRVHPIREGGEYLARRGKRSWGGGYDRAADASERRRREKARAALPPHRRRRNPVLTCPACRNPVHVPAGATSGGCPHCGARVRVNY